eukprot:symbB.v1.2.005913.t1/scaffold347.1/size224350/8
MRPGAFLMLLRPAEDGQDFEVLLQQRAQHLRATWLARSRRRWSRLPTSLIEDPRTWGLVGGQLDWEEWCIYHSDRVGDKLRSRVLRRAALREALEEMSGALTAPHTPILFEPMCVQIAADGKAMHLRHDVQQSPVPNGLSFLEMDETRSRQLRLDDTHTYVFVYLSFDCAHSPHRSSISAALACVRRAAMGAEKPPRQPRRMPGDLRMIHVRSAVAGEQRTLLTMDPELFKARMAGDQSFIEIVKEEVRSRMGIPYLRQKLVVGDCADLDRPREVELRILDYVDSHGTRLRNMADAGRIEEAEACLMLPQEPNSVDWGGETAALKACRRGHMEMMQLLRYADADINVANNDGETPLLDIVEFLLDNNVEKDPSNCWGETPVYKAAEKNHHEILTRLLEVKAHKEKPTYDGTTPLAIAAEKGNAQSVTALLRVGANKSKANDEGATPVFAAAKNGHKACVHLLLQAGADRYKATKRGQMPLFAAAQAGHLEVVKLLVELRRGDKEARYNNATALYVAALKGYVPIVTALLESSADINGATPVNETPLFVAALRNQEEVVKVLLRNSADVNKSTLDGATPLIVAAQEGHSRIVKALLEAGADHCLRMSTGETALSLAKDDLTKDLFWTTRSLRPSLATIRGPNLPNALRMNLAV